MERFDMLRPAIALAAVFCAAVGLAAVFPPMPRMLDRQETLARVAKVTPADAPNANTLTVAESQWVEYAPDGTDITWVDFWVKALTEPGAQELRTVPLWFREGWSDSGFLLAETVAPDGTVTPIDLEANVAVATSNSGHDANIYDPSSKRVVLTVPKIAVGDTLHVVAAYRTIKPRIPETFCTRGILESFDGPVPYSELTVVAPKELPLKSQALLNEVPGTVTASRETLADGRTLHRWVARDVPQSFAEDKMPDPDVVLQRVAASSFESWQQLSKWYWGLCEKHLATTPAIDAKVKELTEGKDREAQIEALFGFVAQGIRYMGIIAENTAPGFEPHDVSLTFENRYGVCRDKGALLVAMLRKAGFDAFPVIIHAGSPRDREVPMPYFNHAVVAIDEGNRNYRLLDPTDDTARATFPAYLSNCSYLVARPEGEDLLESPVPGPEDNMAEIETVGTLDAAGTLELAATIRLNGVNDNVYRSTFVRAQPERLRDMFDGILKRTVSGAELATLDIEPADPKDISKPLVVRLRARVPGYGTPDATGRTLLTLPFLSRALGMVNFLFGGLDQPERKYDWEIEAPCGVRETLTLKGIGSLGKPTLLPDDPILKSNGASFDIVCRRAENGDLALTRELVLSHKVYTPEDYRSLRRFKERMSRVESLRPLFVKDAVRDVDAEVLRARVEETLAEDGSVASTRTVMDKRILTFQGKRANGEASFVHNPDLCDITLNAVEVATATGDRVPITEKEISRLDVDGAALAPRYPAFRQTVLSLPAIDIGAVTHVDVSTKARPGAATEPYVTVVAFGNGAYPTHEESYSLTLPLALDGELRVAERNFANVAVTRTVVTNGTQVCRTWTVRDLPAVKPEPATPSPVFTQPTLFLALRRSAAHRVLPAVIARVEALADDPGEAVEDTAERLVAGLDGEDLDGRLRAVQAFMAKRIRAAGPAWHALRRGTHTPPATTLAEGYGNRLDRLTLQLALLRAADVEARLVFANDNGLEGELLFGDRLALRQVPRWNAWATPYIQLADGRLVGDENELDEPGTAGTDSCALMTAQGRTLYTRPDNLRTRSERHITLVLQPNGDATIARTTYAWGALAGATRETARDITPERRRRAIAALAESIAPGATPVSEYTVATKSYPTRTRLAVEAKAYAQRRGRLLSLPLHGTVATLYGLRGVTRENPIWQEGVEESRATVELWLPPGSEILSKPEPFTLTLPGGGRCALTCARSTTAKGWICLTYTLTHACPPAILDAWAFPALIELDRRLATPTMRTLILRLPE